MFSVEEDEKEDELLPSKSIKEPSFAFDADAEDSRNLQDVLPRRPIDEHSLICTAPS